MATGEVQTIRRLLRHAFTELLTLSDRVVALEEKSDAAPKTTKRNVEVAGTVDLTAGAFLRRGAAEEVPESTVVSSPLLRGKLKFPLPLPESHCETTFTTAFPEQQLKLNKVLFRGDWFRNLFKLVYCPIGGTGPDIIPTLNPNADEGLSQMMRQGCPVHHECSDSMAIGAGITQKGDMIGTGLFHQNQWASRERLTSLSQLIISPTENLTFGIFAAHAWQRCIQDSVGSCSTQPRPMWPSVWDWRFGLFGPVTQQRGQDSRRGSWSTDTIKLGSVGAWNMEDEYVLSGWWSIKNAKYQLRGTQLDSLGVALSTFPYANTPTQKIAFQISHTEDVRKYSVECSSKHVLENGMELHPGVILDFSSSGISTMLGIKTLLKF